MGNLLDIFDDDIGGFGRRAEGVAVDQGAGQGQDRKRVSSAIARDSRAILGRLGLGPITDG